MPGHSRTWVLTENAWNELVDILDYSERAWGAEQHATYRLMFMETFELLAHSPGIGRIRDDVNLGLRSHLVGSHIVCYWTTDSEIHIAHILHGRQDPVSRDSIT